MTSILDGGKKNNNITVASFLFVDVL